LAKPGRPAKYSDDDIASRIGAIAAWKRNGLTDKEICGNLGISQETLCQYKHKYPELAEALKASRDEANAQVENALHKSALSGNIAAQIFWLKNRKSSDWRDKQDIEHSGKLDLTIDQIEERQKSGFLKFWRGDK
jgi:transcriptional regulator with XRE-family HTH domain